MSPQLRKPPSFGLAIAGATGVSGSSACRVPKLLLPSEVGVSKVAAMTAIEGGFIDGRAFHRLQAQPQQLEKSTMLETVWIDKDAFQFSVGA
jgi:hypothetical protein